MTETESTQDGTKELGFTGDVMLGRKVDEAQKKRGRPPEAVWGNILSRLRELDGLFINLECCLSKRGEKWTRTHRPFHFRSDPDWSMSALEEAKVDYANLANNHMLDFGEVALKDTLEHLSEAGIAFSGAGRNREEAHKPAFFSAEDIDIGVTSFTDNTPEFEAGEESPGTARIEINVENNETKAAVEKAISEVKSQEPDIIVTSLHWGPNMVQRPPKDFQKFAHWLVEKGVDVIHGHSAHIFQGIETYEGSVIIYDTGDFVDDYAVDKELRNDRSFLFVLEIDSSKNIEMQKLRLIPTEIYDYSVHHADEEARNWSVSRMRELSEEFGTEFEREGNELVAEIS